MCEATVILSRAAAIAALFAVSGCMQTMGDLGRPVPSLSPGRAYFATTALGNFDETDQEREMHNRVWRFLRAPHTSGWFDAELARHMKPAEVAAARGSYYRWLMQTPYRSSSVRYAGMAVDIDADLGTLAPTFASICAVVEVDRQRTIAVAGLSDMEEEMAAGVAARKARNDNDIGRFKMVLRLRLDAYSYALDHLLVETPHPAAVDVDARLGDLEVYAELAERQRFCDGVLGARHESAIPARAEMAPVELEPESGSQLILPQISSESAAS